MSSENVKSQEKIILAAIDLIEDKGMQNLTIRNIAKKAGVNSAAINYYFRSKEKLLEEVLRTTVDHAITDWEEIIDKESIPPKKRLEEFLIYLMDGAINFPGITMAHLYEPLINKNYNNRFVLKFNVLMNNLQQLVGRINPNVSDKELKFITIQIVASSIMPSLVPEMFQDFSGLSFSDKKIRGDYIRLIIRSSIKKNNPD